MSTSQLIRSIKNELKSAGMTYAELGQKLGMAESTIKRMLSRGDMPLSRVDAICNALQIDFSVLAKQVADAQPMLQELTLEQERQVVRNRKLLLTAICVMSQWTFEQITAHYQMSDAEVIQYMSQLDKIGILELRPLNRYRLKLAKTFRWRPNGPVMNYFRNHVMADYFSGDFGNEGECLMLVHGSIGRSHRVAFKDRIAKLAQDFAMQHQTDQKVPPKDRAGMTMLLCIRDWEFQAFAELRRDASL
jgi:transcriptional regulator with XRE-family HTH domain